MEKRPFGSVAIPLHADNSSLLVLPENHHSFSFVVDDFVIGVQLVDLFMVFLAAYIVHDAVHPVSIGITGMIGKNVLRPACGSNRKYEDEYKRKKTQQTRIRPHDSRCFAATLRIRCCCPGR